MHKSIALLFVLVLASFILFGCTESDTPPANNSDIGGSIMPPAPTNSGVVTPPATNADLCSNANYSTKVNYNSLLGQEVIELDYTSGKAIIAKVKADGYEAVSDISDLTCLQALTISPTNGVEGSANALASLTNLKLLNLGTNSLDDISFISGMNNLEYLDISNTHATDFSALNGLNKMKILKLSKIQTLQNISFVSSMMDLEELHMYQTASMSKIDFDLSVLTNKTRLQEVDLYKTGVSDLTPLHGLTTLEQVNFAQTNVTVAGCEAFQTALPNVKLMVDNCSQMG